MTEAGPVESEEDSASVPAEYTASALPDVGTASSALPATAGYMEAGTASAPVETTAAEPGTAEDTEEDCTERAVRVPVNKPVM